MIRILAVAAIAVLIASAFIAINSNSAQAQTQPYQLTVRNLTQRQPISPPIVVIHESNAVILPRSAGRLEGLEAFAETGRKPALMEALRNRTGVKEVSEFGGPISPQSQQTIFTNLRAEPGDHISVIGMLMCTNDAITIGTAIISNEDDPAFGSGIVLDAGTEENDESRRSVPCPYPGFDSAGDTAVSHPDTEDGEGRINPHTGIQGIGDLGEVFNWDRTVMEFVVDKRGTGTPKRAFDVGLTLQNLTNAQPITPPVVVAHDKNVDVVAYTRPRELLGIDRLSEGGDASVLLDTLAAHDGVVSVTQLPIGGSNQPWRISQRKCPSLHRQQHYRPRNARMHKRRLHTCICRSQRINHPSRKRIRHRIRLRLRCRKQRRNYSNRALPRRSRSRILRRPGRKRTSRTPRHPRRRRPRPQPTRMDRSDNRAAIAPRQSRHT